MEIIRGIQPPMESGIHRHGIRNPQRGIRNPGLSWITLHGAIVSSTSLVAVPVYALKRSGTFVSESKPGYVFILTDFTK